MNIWKQDKHECVCPRAMGSEKKSHYGSHMNGQMQWTQREPKCALHFSKTGTDHRTPCPWFLSSSFLWSFIFLGFFFGLELDLKHGGLLIKNTINIIIYLKLDFHPLNTDWPHETKHPCADKAQADCITQSASLFANEAASPLALWTQPSLGKAQVSFPLVEQVVEISLLCTASPSFTISAEFFHHSSAEEELSWGLE